MSRSRFERAFAQAGVLVALGLAVQIATLYWPRPTSFLLFAGAGVTLVAAGIARYLLALIARD